MAIWQESKSSEDFCSCCLKWRLWSIWSSPAETGFHNLVPLALSTVVKNTTLFTTNTHKLQETTPSRFCCMVFCQSSSSSPLFTLGVFKSDKTKSVMKSKHKAKRSRATKMTSTHSLTINSTRLCCLSPWQAFACSQCSPSSLWCWLHSPTTMQTTLAMAMATCSTGLDLKTSTRSSTLAQADLALPLARSFPGL